MYITEIHISWSSLRSMLGVVVPGNLVNSGLQDQNQKLCAKIYVTVEEWLLASGDRLGKVNTREEYFRGTHYHQLFVTALIPCQQY